MANASGHVYVGSARISGKIGGIFRRKVGEDGWQQLTKGLPEQTNVQAITVHPTNPDVVYIGTNDGPYRSANRGDSWERLDFPKGLEAWSIAFQAGDPRVIYVGTAPVGVFKSEDGGQSFRKLPKAVLPERVQMGFPCRVMRMASDPARPKEVYATLEVGGVMRTLDGGESWDDCTSDLVKLAEQPHLKSKIQSDTHIEGMLDGHALTVSAAQAGTVFLAVRMGLFQSDDRGSSWSDMQIGKFSPLTYGRDVRVSPQDPRTLYACLSPAARSEDGSLYRSQDLGQTWKRFDHGIKADRTMMAVALHPTNPDQVYCVSRSGQVFGTEDGGSTWREHRVPDVQDVYALACA
jgi:photosystem II stability/assembly factor-like uncharacterized protein